MSEFTDSLLVPQKLLQVSHENWLDNKTTDNDFAMDLLTCLRGHQEYDEIEKELSRLRQTNADIYDHLMVMVLLAYRHLKLE